MDDSTFDRLARAVGTGGTRRNLLGVLTGLGLGSVLSVIDADDAAAEKPHERLRRHKNQRRRKQRNRKQHNTNGKKTHGNGNGGGNKNGGGGGLGGPQQCTATGDACQQNRDCCKGNCFNQVCTNTPNQCGGQDCPENATGCCAGNCCTAPANQCNPQGECCAPNCTGRRCGPDGCGGNGTCGSCPPNSVCNNATGLCSCGPENCDGCCDANGVCQPGTTHEQCGGSGIACYACGANQYCSAETGTCRDNPPCSAETCPNGCCFEDASGFHVCRTDLRGCAPGGVCCDGCCDSAGVCQPGTDHGVCGKNGSTCMICNILDPLCDDGRCQCDANNCDGCCTNGPGNQGLCQPGTDNDLCGFGGGQCVVCPTGTTCDGQGHCQCLNTDEYCGVGTNCVACPTGTTCNGQGKCQCLNTDQYCGTGTDCVACGDGNVCNGQGQCVCSPERCTSDSGRSCQSGLCRCDWDLCEGCCQDGLCTGGGTAQACRTERDACTVCTSGDNCDDTGFIWVENGFTVWGCCPAGSSACGGECCAAGEYCCGGCCPAASCCEGAGTCCPGGAECCNDTCCPTDQPRCLDTGNGTMECSL